MKSFGRPKLVTNQDLLNTYTSDKCDVAFNYVYRLKVVSTCHWSPLFAA